MKEERYFKFIGDESDYNFNTFSTGTIYKGSHKRHEIYKSVNGLSKIHQKRWEEVSKEEYLLQEGELDYLPKKYAVYNDGSEHFKQLFIKYANSGCINVEFLDGSDVNNYYEVDTTIELHKETFVTNICGNKSYLDEDTIVLTIDQFAKASGIKKIILGYVWKDGFSEKYLKLACKIVGIRESMFNLGEDGVIFKDPSPAKNSLQEEGVLDEWFKPVYVDVESPIKAGDWVIGWFRGDDKIDYKQKAWEVGRTFVGTYGLTYVEPKKNPNHNTELKTVRRATEEEIKIANAIPKDSYIVIQDMGNKVGPAFNVGGVYKLDVDYVEGGDFNVYKDNYGIRNGYFNTEDGFKIRLATEEEVRSYGKPKLSKIADTKVKS